MVGKVTPNYMASASIIAAILGQDKYKTPNQCLRACINASNGIAPPEWVQSKQAAFGDRIEGFLAQSACETIGGSKLKLDYDEPYFHKELPLACSLDATCFADTVVEHDPEKGIYVFTPSKKITLRGTGVIECKNTSVKPSDGPAPYRGPLQLQAQMMCTSLNWGVVATLYGGYDLRLYFYDNDPSVQTIIANRTRDFDRRITEQDFYAPESSDDANIIWPEPLAFDAKPLADFGEDIDDICEEIADAKRVKKAMDAKIDACQNLLKIALGDHVAGVAERYQLEWPMTNGRAEKTVVYASKEPERAKSVRIKAIEEVRRNVA
ncbi:MAG: hypothetical protein ACPHX7_06280 [Candidatus Puniceispirillaceae bacterium]